MSRDADRQTGTAYPNGIHKSRLYDVFLCCRDFACTPLEYEEDRERSLVEEQHGMANCEWYSDTDGNLVVGGLQLRDSRLRIVIAENGFTILPKVESAPIIFISYAREDYDHARRLADALNEVGFRYWLDTERLVPGQRWGARIREAIKRSDFVVALLSSVSVGKRGYVQKEIRRALDVLDEVPDQVIYLIPARLDPCEPAHDALRDLHWVDLFPNWTEGIQRLFSALENASRSDQ